MSRCAYSSVEFDSEARASRMASAQRADSRLLPETSGIASSRSGVTLEYQRFPPF
jgi:hypothetical protein